MEMACQPPNIFRIDINRIGCLAAYSTALALKVKLGPNAHIIIGIEWHIITMIRPTDE